MKKIRLLDAASQDLMDGVHFYEKQEKGLDGNDILVYAILDCRKNPAWARKRLR